MLTNAEIDLLTFHDDFGAFFADLGYHAVVQGVFMHIFFISTYFFLLCNQLHVRSIDLLFDFLFMFVFWNV